FSGVVSVICLVGVVSNTLNLTVFLRGNLKESHYTYLTVLSASDLTTVWLVFFSGLARGVLKDSLFWGCFDAFVHLPLGSASTSISILTLMLVTFERLVIIKAPVASMRLCTTTVARQASAMVILFSVIFSIPYCFTFIVKDGHIKYHHFAKSQYYSVHNWIRLVLFGFLPGVVLLLGNLLLLHSLRPRKYQQQSLHHQQPAPSFDSSPSSNSHNGISTPSLKRQKTHRGKNNNNN
ncbi:unnamed protein product, partial [Meganyctiphanes norvegica]